MSMRWETTDTRRRPDRLGRAHAETRSIANDGQLRTDMHCLLIRNVRKDEGARFDILVKDGRIARTATMIEIGRAHV